MGKNWLWISKKKVELNEDFSNESFNDKNKNDYIHLAFEYAVEYKSNTYSDFKSSYL